MANLSAGWSEGRTPSETRSMCSRTCVPARWISWAVNYPMTLIPMSQFGELLEKLARAEVRYVLVGGAAVLLHGYARATADLDILVETSEENARRLLGVLAAWGELEIQELAFPQLGALRVIEDFALDIFTLMSAKMLARDLSYADLAGDAQRCVLGSGVEIFYASVARLMDLKAGIGQPKDAADIMVLSEITLDCGER